MPLPLLDPSPVQATFRTALFALILGGGTLLWLLRAGTMVRLIPQGLRAIARDRGRALGHMLAGGVGIGTVGVTVLAVETGGPGALAWIWLAGLVGMAFHRAHFDIAHAPGQASRPGLLPALAGQLGRLGAVIAGLVALASVAVAITLGGAFQAQQGSQLLAATTPIRGLWLGPILAVVIATAVLLRRKTTRTWVSPLALVLVGAYCLGLLALLLGDLEATGQALSAVFDQAFAPGATIAGTAGGSMLAVAEVAVLRATQATHAGLGFVEHEPGDPETLGNRGAVAGLVPLLHTLVIATLTGLTLLVHTGNGQPVAVASRMLTPLAEVQRVAARPSIYGQSFLLPSDTKMERNHRYPMKMLPHPRGHSLGQIADDNRTVGMMAWASAKDVDSILLRPRDRSRQNPGFDIVIPCTRKEFKRHGVPWLELEPIDPKLDLNVYMKAHNLDGPFVPLAELPFTGTAVPTFSRDGKAQLSMIEEPRGPAAQLHPTLSTATKLGFAGPFFRHDSEPDVAWALPTAPGYSLAPGSLEHLRLDPSPRGIELGVLTTSGQLEVPAWEFLAATKTAVLRHQEDPSRDLLVPVRGYLHRGNLRFDSALEGFDLNKLKYMIGYEPRLFLLPPPYRFDVEAHTGTRLAKAAPESTALIPTVAYTHRRTDPEALYQPGPREVLRERDMLGPVLDREGAATLREAVASRLPGGDWLLALTLLPLLALSLPAWLGHGVTGAQHLLGPTSKLARPLVGGMMVAAVITAATLSLADIMTATDLAVSVLAEINVLALIAFIPLLRKLRSSS